MPESIEKLWGIKDVMAFTGFCRSKIWSDTKSGLKYIKSGRSIRFLPESVIAFYKSQEVKRGRK